MPSDDEDLAPDASSALSVVRSEADRLAREKGAIFAEEYLIEEMSEAKAGGLSPRLLAKLDQELAEILLRYPEKRS